LSTFITLDHSTAAIQTLHTPSCKSHPFYCISIASDRFFSFQGFYARENGKIILGMGCNSPRGGRPASVVARERSIASAQAFIQAAFLFPEDEETRIECLEMGLEELLKVCEQAHKTFPYQF
jgi:hypothetical protein